jgi:hypothetical protein
MRPELKQNTGKSKNHFHLAQEYTQRHTLRGAATFKPSGLGLDLYPRLTFSGRNPPRIGSLPSQLP